MNVMHFLPHLPLPSSRLKPDTAATTFADAWSYPTFAGAIAALTACLPLLGHVIGKWVGTYLV